MIHKNNINQNSILLKNIQNTFKRINNFWKETKKNKKLNGNNKKSDIPKKEGSSFSSLSSTPILKFENNNNIFRINIDFSQDNSDNDININENQNRDNEKDDIISYSIIDSNNSNSIFLLKKKRDKLIGEKDKENNYNENNENNIKIRDYFSNLNIYNNKKLIEDVTIFFK
jgi:hypothetical protein